MFGNNPIEKYDKKGDGSTLRVQEVFSTIQGEGPHAGRRATFIRLWGCHLKCYFCDTDFTTNNEVRDVEGLYGLVEQCKQFGNELIVLTGGEPMRQNIVPLIVALLQEPPEGMPWGSAIASLSRPRFEVQIETAGSFWFREEDKKALGQVMDAIMEQQLTIVVSPKTPSVHPAVERAAIAWKYVVSADTINDSFDGLPVVNFQERGAAPRPLARPPASVRHENIFVQPMDEGDGLFDEDNRNACVGLVQRHGYRLSLQQHKIVGVP